MFRHSLERPTAIVVQIAACSKWISVAQRPRESVGEQLIDRAIRPQSMRGGVNEWHEHKHKHNNNNDNEAAHPLVHFSLAHIVSNSL